jgi:excisionase family DNA binding protein
METLVEQLQARCGLMSVNELAALLGSHAQTIYKWTRKHQLPCIRVGGRVKFDPITTAGWLRARSVG